MPPPGLAGPAVDDQPTHSQLLPRTPELSMTEEKIQRAEIKSIDVKQKGQGAKAEMIDPTAPGHPGHAQQHLEQR